MLQLYRRCIGRCKTPQPSQLEARGHFSSLFKSESRVLDLIPNIEKSDWLFWCLMFGSISCIVESTYHFPGSLLKDDDVTEICAGCHDYMYLTRELSINFFSCQLYSSLWVFRDVSNSIIYQNFLCAQQQFLQWRVDDNTKHIRNN